MSTNYLQTANSVFSCPEFALKMGPKPIFVGRTDTAKFPGFDRVMKRDGMSTNYLQTANFVFSCPEFALKMGPEHIFTDVVGTAKFPRFYRNGGGQA